MDEDGQMVGVQRGGEPSECFAPLVVERGVHDQLEDRLAGDGVDELFAEGHVEVVAYAGRPLCRRPDPGRVAPHGVEMVDGLAVEIATAHHEVEEFLGRLELGEVGGVGVGEVVAGEHLAARHVPSMLRLPLPTRSVPPEASTSRTSLAWALRSFVMGVAK